MRAGGPARRLGKAGNYRKIEWTVGSQLHIPYTLAHPADGDGERLAADRPCTRPGCHAAHLAPPPYAAWGDPGVLNEAGEQRCDGLGESENWLSEECSIR